MIIESLIRRANGTNVEFGKTVYQFRPSENDPRHLCDVKNAEHSAQLLSIKHAFRAAVPLNKKAAAAEAEAEAASEPDQEQDLITQAKALGIKANRSWGIPKLEAAIAEAKAKLQ